MTFDDEKASPKESSSKNFIPIADQIRNRFSKEGSNSGSPREKTPSRKVLLLKKTPMNSPKVSPNMSPIKKKFITDMINDKEDKSNEINENNEPNEIKRIDMLNMPNEIKKKDSNKYFEESKKSGFFA